MINQDKTKFEMNMQEVQNLMNYSKIIPCSPDVGTDLQKIPNFAPD